MCKNNGKSNDSEAAANIQNVGQQLVPVEEVVVHAEKMTNAEKAIAEVARIGETVMVPTGMVGETHVGETVEVTLKAEYNHLVKSAALVSIGNFGSSFLGMIRQIVVVASLGATVAACFSAAIIPINNFYQLLVNGSTDGALVPVFNDYASPEKR